MQCNQQRKSVGATRQFVGWTLLLSSKLLVSLSLLLYTVSPVDAQWFGACCEKEGWYSLDGGTLSWLCVSDEADILSRVNMRTLREYIKQKDYVAAKSVAKQLIERSKCGFVANTELEFYVSKPEPQKDIRLARLRGETSHDYVFHEAVVNKGTKRALNREEQQFVAWATQETQRMYEQTRPQQRNSPDESAQSKRPLDRGTLSISLGMSIQEVSKIFTMQERQDPVVALLKKYSVDTPDKEAANKSLNKRSFLLTPLGTSFPDGVTSIDVQFVRDSLFQIGIHYNHAYIDNVGWLEFVATFVEKFGTPTGGSASHREWSNENTRISVAYSGSVVNVHYTDLVVQRLIDDEEFRMKGMSPGKIK